MAETLTNTNGSLIIKATTAFIRPFYFGTLSQTVTVNLSKNGSAWGAAAGTVAEVGGAGNGKGWYTVTLTTADTGITGVLAYNCTAASGGPVDFCDIVQAQVTTDIVLNSFGRALAGNVLQQNQPVATFPFTMTKNGVPTPGLGASITAQRNFGSGWSNMSNNGTYTDAGFGNYFIALTNLDTNSVSAIYRFTAPTADDNNVIVFFSP